MHETTLVFAIFIAAAFAADDSSRELVYLGMDDCPQGGCSVPIFDKGYMFKIKEIVGRSGPAPDGFSLWDPEGRWMYQVDIPTPDGTPASVHGPAVDTDGTVIVGLAYGKRGSYRGGIVFLDRTGRRIRFVNTDRYHPMALCVAPDHSIWSLGWQRSTTGDVEDPTAYLVRKFSSDGAQIGEFLPRSAFSPGLSPGGSGIAWIRAASDRVGMMVYPGKTSANPEWVELDFEGKLIGNWKLGAHHQISGGGYAFTADGRLFARPYNAQTKSFQLVSFDRVTSSWQKVNENVRGLLLGADGNNLVFRERQLNANGVHALWMPIK